MLSAPDMAALAAAGVAAGVVGTAGGITSMVSYPALLAVGLPALSANFVNNTALVACWPGSALASQPELRGRGAWLAHWCPVAAAGAGAGAGLLLVTPSGAFERIVPFLVAIGSITLLCEPRVTAWRRRRAPVDRDQPIVLAAGLFALSLYGGYFGAGSGVMVLTLMLMRVDRHLPTANALKNMLIGAGVLATATLFVATGSVDWSAAGPLALGSLLGSTLGPRVARRLPTRLLRLLIAGLGIALAIELWIDPHL